MKTEKKKRGRPPKRKVMEFEGMTYEGAKCILILT